MDGTIIPLQATLVDMMKEIIPIHILEHHCFDGVSMINSVRTIPDELKFAFVLL